jgi:hypothetical protein
MNQLSIELPLVEDGANPLLGPPGGNLRVEEYENRWAGAAQSRTQNTILDRSTL